MLLLESIYHRATAQILAPRPPAGPKTSTNGEPAKRRSRQVKQRNQSEGEFTLTKGLPNPKAIRTGTY